ncbi:integrase/recombinase XerC [Chitinophaga skermanii]|uniref:Integrase/recombinase XerC n=1 Tax=Chitinophaga skermanii TaxID=331697 RepID=A0A327Q5K8_9BACT|nr:tyrosine-type recombinase/integrase [Chitinophaga skermanii]RAI99719.1 integrase/recombinase XerC [Chitinophaga skermanii]
MSAATYIQYIEDFLAYIQLERRYSVHTITAYRKDLSQFFTFIEGTYGAIPLGAIQHAHVRSWMAADLKDEQQVTSRTINRKISALKSFFKHALRQKLVSNSPMLKVIPPKINKRLPLFVEEEGMEKLEQNGTLTEPIFNNDFNGATQQLALDIFYQTGIRLSELIELKVRNIDLSNRYVKVLGKGRKERIIPVSENLLAHIEKYLARKAAELAEYDDEILLVNDKGKKLYPKYVYRAVKAALSKVTTIERKSPHILRHTFATHLTNNGADLNAVKELLGHSSLASTQVYTHNTVARLKEIHSKAHPKA